MLLSKKRLAACCMVALGVAGMSYPATITIDPAIKYQTIDGFGGFGPNDVWWSGNGPFFNDAYLRCLVDDMGFTAIRNEHYSEESGQDANWAKMSPWVKAVTDYAKSKNEPLRWILTAWTPPSNMKDNGSLKNGGALKTTVYDAYANWWVTAITNYKSVGADVLGVSMQNEPRFVEPYNSCVMLPPQYRDVLKVVAPKIKAASPTTIMFGPEDMFGTMPNFQEYTTAIIADPVAKPLLGAVAFHGYTESGTTPGAIGTGTIIKLAYLWTLNKSYGYRAWMTETSGYGTNWTGAMSVASSIQFFLRYGKLSLWTYWYTAGDLMNGSNAPTPLGAAHKQYSRYIRPGAVMIESKTSAADSNNLRPAAFVDAKNKTLTITMLNGTASDIVVSGFSGPGLPATFKQYRSTSTENCVAKADVPTATGFTIPASSIVTLVGAYTYVVGVSPQRTIMHANTKVISPNARTFSVDGRQIKSSGTAIQNRSTLSQGVYLQSDGTRMVKQAR